MNKKAKIIIGVLLIGLMLVIMSNNKKSEVINDITPTPTVEIKVTETPIPTKSATEDEVVMAVYRGAFVEGCIDGDNTKINSCRCVFDYFIDNYGLEKMIEAAQDEDASKNPMLIEATVECYSVK